MDLKSGMKVLIHGRYEDFTDHLDGTEATVLDSTVNKQGYIQIEDAAGAMWYVQAIDVEPIEN